MSQVQHDLLPFVSPVDQTPLERRAQGATLCDRSGAAYPIVDGVPRFCESDYAEAFGDQWNRWSRTQLDSVNGSTRSRDRLCNILGEDLGALRGKRVLEVGAGAGRFTEVLAAAADTVVAVDLSHAIDANRANNARFSNLALAQASIYALPVPDDAFDVGFMLGVIQHTPDPLESLRALSSKVRPGGRVCVDFYAWSASFATRFGLHAAHAILRRREPRAAAETVERLFAFFDPIHRRFARGKFGHWALTRVSPLVSYYHRARKMGLPEEELCEWGHLDTHDQLTDRYKHLFTLGRVRRYCAALDLAVDSLERRGIGIELRASRVG